MKTKRINISHDELCEILEYNPQTGLCYWKIKRGGKAQKGRLAGTGANTRGYWSIYMANPTLPLN